MSSPLEGLTALLFTVTPVVALNLPMSPAQIYTVNYTTDENTSESFSLLATSRRHAINSTIEIHPDIKQINLVELAPEF